MIGLAVGLGFPLFAIASGAVYALFFDPKSELPRGSFRRLQ